MNQQKLKAFTLVELIVVITILAILGTIAFISLQGYSKTARDTTRTSDMSKIKTTLELFQLDAGKYPDTTGGVAVTFSGEVIWTQGLFGITTFTSVSKLDKIPKDPLTDKEYIFSVTNTKQEYEIAGIMEGNDFAIINKSYAGDKTASVRIIGNYNGKILKVFEGGQAYILAVPTIISASGITIEDIMLNQTFAYNGYSNLPFSYSGSSYNTLGETDLSLVDINNYIVYSGSLSSLTGEDATARVLMLQNLQSAYSGSIIQNSAIDEILAITDFTVNNPIVVNLAGTVVNNTLGASISLSINNDTLCNFIQTNLVINGGFDIDTNGWEIINLSSSIADGILSIDDIDPYGSGIKQIIPTIVGQKYIIEIDRVSATWDYYVGINGVWLDGSINIDGKNLFTFIANSTASELFISTTSGIDRGTVNIDNISLFPIGNCELTQNNLVINGGFDIDTNGWEIINLSSSIADGILSIDDIDPYGSGIKQIIPTIVGQKYIIEIDRVSATWDYYVGINGVWLDGSINIDGKNLFTFIANSPASELFISTTSGIDRGTVDIDNISIY